MARPPQLYRRLRQRQLLPLKIADDRYLCHLKAFAFFPDLNICRSAINEPYPGRKNGR
jgi:hypothetical protein